ncbi:MAG: VOC family protein [Candidatus Lokiarchaeota archaeon]|nr:VOC family protein [Candidatus Lokiarchaeota archaeon]
MNKPKLGNFELCFDVENLEESVAFYKKLGFQIIKGAIEYGTVCMSNGDIRFTMFIENAIQEQFGTKFLLNFRGGDVQKNYEYLTKEGIKFEQSPKIYEDGVSIDAKLRDPNGNLIYLDTHPSER